MRPWTLAGALAVAAVSAGACSDGTPETSGGTVSAPAAGGHGGAHGAMAQRDADPSRNFALNMMEHHEGAVTMSRSAMEDKLDPEMRALAQKIIADQEREIAQLRAFLERSKPAG